MIQKIELLQNLNENTYKKICNKLNLNDNDSVISNNAIRFLNEKIGMIHLFNIVYKKFGHKWFMGTHINFPKFNCNYNDFEINLYKGYCDILGEGIVSDFPVYDDIFCSYVEYSEHIKVDSALKEICRLISDGFLPEQLDRKLWDNYKMPRGTIELCLSETANTELEVLARCHAPALKKRIPKEYHRKTGVTPFKIINEETERKILDWLYRKYKLTKH